MAANSDPFNAVGGITVGIPAIPVIAANGAITATSLSGIANISGVNAVFSGNVVAANFIGNFVGNISGNIKVPGNDTEIVFGIGGNATTSPALRFDPVANLLHIDGNACFEGNVVAQYYWGDGSNLTGVVADTVRNAAQPNITSVGTLTSLTVSGNLNLSSPANLIIGGTSNVGDILVKTASGMAWALNAPNAISNGSSNVRILSAGGPVLISSGGVANIVTVNTSNIIVQSAEVWVSGNVRANYFDGNGSRLTGLNAANLIGQVPNALSALTVINAAQPNITSLGTLTSLTVNGISTLGPVGNVRINGGNPGQVLSTDGSGGLTWISTALSNVLTDGSSAWRVYPSGNITANIAGTANVLVINQSVITPNANFIPAVNNVYTLGNAINQWRSLYISGNTLYMDGVAVGLSAANPIHQTAGNISLTVSGSQVALYTGAANSNLQSDFSIANSFVGEGGNLSNIQGANVVGPVANATWAANATHSDTANTVTDAAQPNITSVGTLISLVVTGNVDAGNVNATSNVTAANVVAANGVFTLVTGTLTAGPQPNITSIGTLTSLAVTGGITAGNVDATGRVTAPVAQFTTIAGSLITNAQPNITTVGSLSNLTVLGNANVGNLYAFSGTMNANTVTGNYFVVDNSQFIGNILPAADAFYNLGSPLLRWKDLYLSPTSLYLGTAKVTASGNTVQLPNVTVQGGVIGELSPAISLSANLGSPTRRWKDVYLSNNSLYLGFAHVTSYGPPTTPIVKVPGLEVEGFIVGNLTPASNSVFSIGSPNAQWQLIGAGSIQVGNTVISSDGSGGLVLGSGNTLTTTTPNGSTTSNSFVAANSVTANALVANIANIVQINVAGNIAANGNIRANGGLYANSDSYFSQDVTVAGNLTVMGNLTYTDINTLSVIDPIIDLGTGPNGAPLTSNDGKDRGLQLFLYDAATSTEVNKFMGWKNATDEFIFASNVSVANSVVTVNEWATVQAGTFVGSGSGLSNIAGANVTGTVANAAYAPFANVANVANSVAAGNVVGTVANAVYSLYANVADTANTIDGTGVTGTVANANFAFYSDTANSALSVDAANVTGTVDNANAALYAANITVGAQPNITSLGTLTGLSVTGLANLGDVGNLIIGGGANGQFLQTDGNGELVWANAGGGGVANGTAIINGTSNVTVAASGNISVGVSGTPNTAVFTDTGAIFTGNITVGNVTYGPNYIQFANLGVNPPTLNAISNGTKIRLWQSSNATMADYSIGIEAGATWFSIPQATANFAYKWYAGNTEITTLYGNGRLNVSSIQVGGTSNLGAVGNVKITGGTSGQFLTTTGNGDLGWTSLTNTSRYLYARRTSNQTISSGNWANRDIVFDLVDTSSGITYSTTTGLFTLTAGITYRISAAVAWSGASSYLYQYAVYSSANIRLSPLFEEYPPTSASNNVSSPVIEWLYTPTTTIQVKIRTTPNTTGLTGEYIRGDLSTFLSVQAVAGQIGPTTLAELGDVAVANIANGQVLTYNSSTGKWINATPDAANANYANSASTANTANVANVAYSVSGANVTGEVANANYATFAGTAYSVAGANVTGEVANANYATYANTANSADSVDLANVAGIGNIASIDLDGNVSNVLSGIGTWIAVGGGGGNTSPAGSNTELQFNNAGVFGASANLTFDGTTLTTGNLNTTLGHVFSPNGADSTGSTIGAPGVAIDIQAGRGGNAFTNYNAGPGANLDLAAGDAGANATNTSWGATGGNVNITAGETTGPGLGGSINITAGTGTSGIGNINFSGSVQLGAVANVHITGGNTGQVLTTDGAGTLSWATVDAANAVYANTANYANYSGEANIANVAYSVDVANVAGLGNIATIDLNGNASTVLAGDGTWVAQAGGTASIVVNDNPPLTAVQGDLWWDSTTGKLKVYYVDADGGQWVDASPTGGGEGGASGSESAISNGTSYANIATSDGNLVIGVDSDNMTWTFATDRVLYGKTDEDITIAAVDTADDGYQVRQIITDGSGNTFASTSLDADSFRINLDQQGTGYQWRFDGNALQAGQDSKIYGYNNNVAVQSMSAGSATMASLQSVSHVNDPNVYSSIDATTTGANIKVYNGGSNGGTEYAWQFDNTGNLTLPGGGSLYSNPFTPSGAPGNTITLQPAGSGVTTDQRLLVYPTAGDGDHIHLTSGNLYQTELFLGSDNLYVKLANTGNVVINSNDSNGNAATWTFGTDGNLTVPGNISAAVYASPAPYISGFSSISTIDGANLGGFTFDTSNLTLPGNTFSVNYANGTQVPLGGSAAGSNNQIQFNSGGAFSASGNLKFTDTIGGGTVEIGNELNLLGNGTIGTGAGNLLLQPAGNIIMQASGYYLTFDIAGNLTLPGNTRSINFANGSAAFGNVASINLDGSSSNVLYGNGAFAPISSSQVTKASGLVNPGTFVTLDNLKATVTASGQRGLSLATVSGSNTYLVGGNYSLTSASVGGSAGALSVTTTATNSVFNWNFLGAGDLSTYILTDASNGRAYRITLQIGSAFTNNLISIERLV